MSTSSQLALFKGKSGEPYVQPVSLNSAQNGQNVLKTQGKAYYFYSGSLEFMMCIFLLVTYLKDGYSNSLRGEESSPERTHYHLGDSLPFYIMMVIYLLLSSLKIIIKIKMPNKGDKKNRTQKRYALKALSDLRLVPLIFMITLQKDHKKFFVVPLFIFFESCIKSWNKESRFNKSVILAFIGSWYPECVFAITNPTVYSNKIGDTVGPTESTHLAICYIVTCMCIVAFQSSFNFYTGVILLVIWILTGNSEITQGVYDGSDYGQAFNVLVLWHITAGYVLTCMTTGTFGSTKFILKVFINLFRRQKFCCPISRNIKVGKKIFCKDLVGVPIAISSKIKEGLENLICNEEITYRQNSGKLQKGSVEVKIKKVTDEFFNVKVKNGFEELGFEGCTLMKCTQIAMSCQESIPFVETLSDLEAVYFGHCSKLGKVVFEMEEYKLQQVDKHVITGSWELQSEDGEVCRAYNKDGSLDKNYFKLFIVCKEVLGEAYSDLISLFPLKVKEAAVRDLIGNKKSKILFNAYKHIYKIRYSFKFSKSLSKLLEVLEMSKVERRGANSVLINGDEVTDKLAVVVTLKKVLKVEALSEGEILELEQGKKSLEERRFKGVEGNPEKTENRLFPSRGQNKESKAIEEAEKRIYVSQVVSRWEDQMKSICRIFKPDNAHMMKIEETEKIKQDFLEECFISDCSEGFISKNWAEYNSIKKGCIDLIDRSLPKLRGIYTLRSMVGPKGKNYFLETALMSLNSIRVGPHSEEEIYLESNKMKAINWLSENNKKAMKDVKRQTKDILKIFEKYFYFKMVKDLQQDRGPPSDIVECMENEVEAIVQEERREREMLKTKPGIVSPEINSAGEDLKRKREEDSIKLNERWKEKAEELKKTDLLKIDLSKYLKTGRAEGGGKSFKGFSRKGRTRVEYRMNSVRSKILNQNYFKKSLGKGFEPFKSKKEKITSSITGKSIRMTNDIFSSKISLAKKILNQLFYKAVFSSENKDKGKKGERGGDFADKQWDKGWGTVHQFIRVTKSARIYGEINGKFKEFKEVNEVINSQYYRVG